MWYRFRNGMTGEDLEIVEKDDEFTIYNMNNTPTMWTSYARQLINDELVDCITITYDGEVEFEYQDEINGVDVSAVAGAETV